MLDSGERPLVPQWLKTPRSQQKKGSVRCCEVFCVTQVQPLRSTQSEMPAVRSRHSGRSRDFLDERGVKMKGRKELRRTNSDVQSARRAASAAAHARSQSALDFTTRYISRRIPDFSHHSSQSSLSECGSTRSLSQTGMSSRLAELPESCGPFMRHSPESRTEFSPSKVTDFSRLIDTQSSNEDLDAAEIQRINLERSKKLIPKIQTKSIQTKSSLKGRRSSKSPLTPLGKTSPISSARSMAKLDTTSLTMPSPIPQRSDWRAEDGGRDHKTEGKSKEQDRNTFFQSLLKNKSRNEKDTCEFGSQATHLSTSEADFVGDSSADVSLDEPLSEKKVEDCVICVVPPSDEEERFLRSLGWNDTEPVELLTEEEIAAFKARSLNKAMGGKSQCAQDKTGHLRSSQCSPIGPFASFDLAADSGTESTSSSSQSL